MTEPSEPTEPEVLPFGVVRGTKRPAAPSLTPVPLVADTEPVQASNNTAEPEQEPTDP